MAMLKFALIAFICLVSFSASAESEIKATQHPIDIWLESSLAGESSDNGMRQIVLQAQTKWEAEMNKVYKRLMLKLNPNQQVTLRKAQQSWLKYREAEGRAILEIVSSQQGTIHQLAGTDRGMQLVRERTLDLISYEQEFEK
jgi:uncharacterized protein YecT (DUF1311 family)